MPSMSYCVIENTSSDMWACVDKLDNRANDIESNPYEKSSMGSLYNACKEFIKLYENYENDKETFLKMHSIQEYED